MVITSRGSTASATWAMPGRSPTPAVHVRIAPVTPFDETSPRWVAQSHTAPTPTQKAKAGENSAVTHRSASFPAIPFSSSEVIGHLFARGAEFQPRMTISARGGRLLWVADVQHRPYPGADRTGVPVIGHRERIAGQERASAIRLLPALLAQRREQLVQSF